jgi:DNA-3-methyladenine glycosylase II
MPSSFHYHFRRHDSVMHGVIRRIGPYRLKPSSDRFGMLVRSIISQQISMAAARSIRARLEARVAPARVTPGSLAALEMPELRSVGLSPQKATYIHDLAVKVQSGEVRLSHVGRLSDEAVIEELIQIKGIGRWTAQMFLIFALGRNDVFPIDDFGVRAAVTKLYGFDEPPDRAALLTIGQRWSPYASIASWYCWRYLEWSRSQPVDGKSYPSKPLRAALTRKP